MDKKIVAEQINNKLNQVALDLDSIKDEFKKLQREWEKEDADNDSQDILSTLDKI